jgi:hypothetical protein
MAAWSRIAETLLVGSEKEKRSQRNSIVCYNFDKVANDNNYTGAVRGLGTRGNVFLYKHIVRHSLYR